MINEDKNIRKVTTHQGVLVYQSAFPSILNSIQFKIIYCTKKNTNLNIVTVNITV